jgi:hypothetical protein
MYYLSSGGKGDAATFPNRGAAVREYERAIRQYPLPRDEDERDRWRDRETQVRRIADLERVILTQLPTTSSGVSLLSHGQQLEVTEFVDQAMELGQRRPLLLRALHANPARQLHAELRELIARRQQAEGRVASELDELITLKQEQAQRIERWEEDLHLTEINLEQIETFLRALAYDQAMTETNVSDRINRLKTRVQARRESVQELERRINEAVG